MKVKMRNNFFEIRLDLKLDYAIKSGNVVRKDSLFRRGIELRSSVKYFSEKNHSALFQPEQASHVNDVVLKNDVPMLGGVP